MKLTIIFDVPDGEGDQYADVLQRLIAASRRDPDEHRRFWVFHQALRPVGAVVIEDGGKLTEAAQAARREVDQEHPWIPGAAFNIDDRLKPALLALLDTLITD